MWTAFIVWRDVKGYVSFIRGVRPQKSSFPDADFIKRDAQTSMSSAYILLTSTSKRSFLSFDS